MKTSIRIILIVAFIISANSIQSWSETNNPYSSNEKSDSPHRHVEESEVKEPTDYSIYNLQAKWVTQNGKQITLDDLKGRVRVIAMAYTSCQNACPRIVSDMKRIESKIGKNQRDKVGFVLISIDPKRDTPEKLKAFAIERGLDLDRWVLLNGNENNILELAALLGVKYKRVSEADYVHSNMITVLNQKGEVVHQQIGLETKTNETVAAIEKLI